MADHAKLISELRQRVAHLPPLPEEPDFITSEDTLVRFLKSRDWKLEEAARLLIECIEYRRKTRPQSSLCSFCHNRPGFHSMRQVGHDLTGRPVIYSSFVQTGTHKNSAEDSVAHVTYLIENAKRSMAPGLSTWVFVMDYTGMTLGACNPKLAYEMTSMFANHYPERLGTVVCLNYGTVFHGIWLAAKQFLHPNTVAKVRLARNKTKMVEMFSELFSAELSAWLQEEIALNKLKPLPKTQLEFWNPPPQDGKTHDPRGCPSYVTKYVEGYRKTLQSKQSGNAASPGKTNPAAENHAASGDRTTPSGVPPRIHMPHPNIVDQLSGHKLERASVSAEEEKEWLEARSMVEKSSRRTAAGESDEEDLSCDLEIPSDLQIPASALAVGASS